MKSWKLPDEKTDWYLDDVERGKKGFNPNEPRDWHGRWGAAGSAPGKWSGGWRPGEKKQVKRPSAKPMVAKGPMTELSPSSEYGKNAPKVGSEWYDRNERKHLRVRKVDTEGITIEYEGSKPEKWPHDKWAKIKDRLHKSFTGAKN